MASSMKRLKAADMRLLTALWQELADAPAAECDAALRHCLEQLCGLIGACNAIWVGARRQPAPETDDPLRGWRIHGVEHLHHQERRLAMARELASHLDAGQTDPYLAAVIRHAGRTRSHLRTELMNDKDWRSSWIVREALEDERIDDRLEGGHAISVGCESHFALDRRQDERPFNDYERDLLCFFLLGSRTFQRELLLSRGLASAFSPFSLRECDVLKLLLTDASEREIAIHLGIGYRTAHQHAASIYAKLGVRGRQGLMALWLRGGKTGL
ncbi:MAG: helix-turn-helix transcriptional regulator [Thiohalomonadaceae bacterium]